MSFVGTMLLFFLVITSVYDLVVTQRRDEVTEALEAKAKQ